jgi:hypothetical protein
MFRGILGVVLVLCSSSCGEEDRPPVACLAYAAAGLSVEVTNAATAQPICDATVTARQGSYSERLFVTSCSFVGAYERPGTYVVSVSSAGFVPKEATPVTVVMGGGDCPHVEQVRVAIALTPESWNRFEGE